ncbi:MAG: hypothetical protein ACO1TE_21945 [Prosthecobacter sp.]
MKQHLPDLQTAFLCTFFILVAGMSSLLFTGSKVKPLAASHSVQEGLEIFTLAK